MIAMIKLTTKAAEGMARGRGELLEGMLVSFGTTQILSAPSDDGRV
jgi:hypothetical protein